MLFLHPFAGGMIRRERLSDLSEAYADAEPIAAHLATLHGLASLNRGYPPSRERIKGARGSFWWSDPAHPESFLISKLDATYSPKYFTAARGHPVNNLGYVDHVTDIVPHILGRNLSSIVELGNGGGFFAIKFLKRGYDLVTVEGNGNGYAATLSRGVPSARAVKHDLRLPLFLGRRFDVALCTEVVEHVEPPFASQIVLNIVMHSDVVWFSFADVNPKKQAWVDHPNERPLKMWAALFDFYGFGVIELPARVMRETAHRGRLIAYNLSNPQLRPQDLRDYLSSKFPKGAR